MPQIAPRPPKQRVPRVGRPAGRFTQHRRLDQLRQVLENEPRGLTLEEIAATLKITQRSVRRYLRELDGTNSDERFQLLEFVQTRKGGPLRWRIKPGERGRAVSLRRAQAYALLATRRTLEVLRGSALYDEADLALAQIAKVAQTPFRASGKAEISGEQRLEDRFFFVPPPARSYAARGEDLDELFRAVADLRVLRFRPRVKAGEQRAERIPFHPYAMVVHHGAIHVLGRYVTGGKPNAEVDVLLLEAMTDIRTSETEHFELPERFDIAEYVQGEFGIARPVRARFIVEFDARVADEVKSKRVHPQQRFATAPDGRVRVSLPLVDTRAAVAFVLSWGDSARVVEPPELVSEVHSILARAASRYP
ncbi:MAG TPA: WYL domain-containing protein [Labilithrix sp.]|jgi:predicted DNA-binding transcriptional regulator YafY|nr:WYL domain-containing protein [Labilithrix sp.]